MNKGFALCKARAAGMAKATAGRARTFRDRTHDDDGGKAEIQEALADLVQRRREGDEPPDMGEPEDPEGYGDWDF